MFTGRITNGIRITPLMPNTPLPPTLEPIALTSGQGAACQNYYDAKVAEYNRLARTIASYADGSKNSGSSDRHRDQSVALG